MSIRSRIINVGAAKSLEMVIVTIVRFLSVPIFLHAWSAELYGEWLILYSFLAYFSMGHLGFAQAAANEMTMDITRGEQDRVLVTYHSTLLILLAISVILMATTVLAGLLPLHRWLSLSKISAFEFQVVLLFFGACVVASFLVGLFMAGYRCKGNYHRGLNIFNITLLVDFCAMVVLLSLGKGVVAVAISMTVARWAGLAFMMVDLKLHQPWLRLGLKHSQIKEVRRLLSPSLSFVAVPVGSIVINQGVIIAIGSVIGPLEVVVFSSLRTLTNLIVRVFDLVNQAFYPEVSVAWASKNRDLIRRLHLVSCQTSFWLGLLLVAAFAMFGPWVFEIWTRGKVGLDMPIFWSFLGLVLLRSFWYTSFVVPSAINQHQRLSLGYLIVSIVGLVVSVLLVHSGLVWVMIGFVLVEICMVMMVLPRSLQSVDERFDKFVWKMMAPPRLSSIIR